MTPELASSIVIGIGTGLASSFSFLWFLTKLRPNLIISECIAKDPLQLNGENLNAFRFKVLNRTWRSSVYDIEAQLILITYVNSDGGQNLFLQPIKLLKDKTWTLSRITKNDTHAEYAFQFITTENLEEKWTDADNIELRIKAKHSFSGFSKTVRKRYYKPNNTLKDGSLKFGNTL